MRAGREEQYETGYATLLGLFLACGFLLLLCLSGLLNLIGG